MAGTDGFRKDVFTSLGEVAIPEGDLLLSELLERKDICVRDALTNPILKIGDGYGPKKDKRNISIDSAENISISVGHITEKAFHAKEGEIDLCGGKMRVTAEMRERIEALLYPEKIDLEA